MAQQGHRLFLSHRALYIQLVQLTSDEYSVPKGTLGYIEEEFSTGALAVTWVSDPGPGGASVPVLPTHLELVAHLSVRVPQALVDEEIARAQVNIPSWLVRARARALIDEMMLGIDRADEAYDLKS